MIVSYEDRLSLISSASICRLSLATVFLDRVLFSSYPVGRVYSARVVLSPFLFRFMLLKDYRRYGLSAFDFYSSRFSVDTGLRAFAYRVEFLDTQLSLF